MTQRLRVRAAGRGTSCADRQVRVVLTGDRTVSISDESVVTSDGMMRVRLAVDQLDPSDPFLNHKTTQRLTYERAFTAAKAAGLDEAIMLNRRGEAGEASRHTMFVENGGHLATPPLVCGVLPGVLQRSLIECGAATKTIVTRDMLVSRRLWLGNSLHRLRRAAIVAC